MGNYLIICLHHIIPGLPVNACRHCLSFSGVFAFVFVWIGDSVLDRYLIWINAYQAIVYIVSSFVCRYRLHFKIYIPLST